MKVHIRYILVTGTVSGESVVSQVFLLDDFLGYLEGIEQVLAVSIRYLAEVLDVSLRNHQVVNARMGLRMFYHDCLVCFFHYRRDKRWESLNAYRSYQPQQLVRLKTRSGAFVQGQDGAWSSV